MITLIVYFVFLAGFYLNPLAIDEALAHPSRFAIFIALFFMTAVVDIVQAINSLKEKK